jgi:hypothetical protein
MSSSQTQATPGAWTSMRYMEGWLQPHDPATDFEISAQHTAKDLRVKVSGTPAIDQLISTLHVFGVESELYAVPVVLIDLRELRTEYSRLDLLIVGYEIACSFAHLRRLALLVQPHRVTQISEREARRGGIDMRVFSDEAAANDWLQQAG